MKDTINARNHKLGAKEAILALIFGIAVVASIARCDRTPSEPRKPTALAAWGMCQHFLSKRLKAPATAEYPSPYDRFIKQLDDNTFHTEAYVDAKNAFGVPLRASFVCTVRYAGDDVWDLVYLNLREP